MTCSRVSFSRTKSCRLNTVMVDLFCIKRHSIYILTMEFFSVPFFGGNFGKIVKLIIIINIKCSEFSPDWASFFFFLLFIELDLELMLLFTLKKYFLRLHIKKCNIQQLPLH